MTAARLWIKLRWRIIAAFVSTSLMVGGAGILYVWNLKCSSSLNDLQCSRFREEDGLAYVVTLVLAVIPAALGILLGVGATAGEIQDGTTAFAWSVAPSRNRWLAEHLTCGSLTVASLGLLCGVLNAIIVAKLNPGHELTASFVGYGLWGPILAIRGICAFGVAVAIGLIVRRTVPSLTLGVVVAALAIIAALTIGRSFQTAEVLPDSAFVQDDLGVSSVVRTSNGSYEAWSECANRVPAGLSENDRINWQSDHCVRVPTFLPGSAMMTVEVRESLVLVVLGFSGFAVSILLIGSRRP
jgi:hypothetical protein